MSGFIKFPKASYKINSHTSLYIYKFRCSSCGYEWKHSVDELISFSNRVQSCCKHNLAKYEHCPRGCSHLPWYIRLFTKEEVGWGEAISKEHLLSGIKYIMKDSEWKQLKNKN